MSRYATLQQLYGLGAPETSFSEVSEDMRESALTAACDVVDSYLSNRFTLPLVTFGGDVTRAVCIIAAYDLLSGRGWNPASTGGDSDQLSARYDSVKDWLRDVARGLVTPVVTDSSAPTGGAVEAGGLPAQVVVAPRQSCDGFSYTVGPPQPRGW